MENLLNAEVIKAAASSTLGILCLMCLILGIIALALFKDAPIGAKLSVFVLLLIGAVGFGYVITKQQLPNLMPEKPHEFILGQWQNGQKIGDIEAGSIITYFEDGSFSGTNDSFVKGQGERKQIKGRWELKQLPPDKGQLVLKFNDGKQWQSTFKIIDRNRTHNIEENYDSVRISD
ncbi:MAG: hypothetical protein KJ826_04315 [Proteobacteria bacterium]|nr:hypothetical protein [Pseudomonadota bacterium]